MILNTELRLFLLLFIIPAIIIAIAIPVQATSTRVNPYCGYTAHDFDLEDENGETTYWLNGKNYSGGLDTYYTPEGGNSWDTRYFLKVEDGDFDSDSTSDDIRVALFDYNGKFKSVLGQVDIDTWSWSQAIKVDPDEERVWFSYTQYGGMGDKFYSVKLDGTDLQEEFRMDCNWEVEWSTDPNPSGQGDVAFFAGLNSSDWDEPHSIFIWTGSNLQKVVEVGGASCGFAFDSSGNLWSGSYTFSEQEYVYMWTASQIDTAVDTNTLLTTANATAKFPIPVVVHPVTSTVYAAGVNDVECDSSGTVYISANGGFDLEPPPGGMNECGYVIQITSMPLDPLDDEDWVEGTHWNYISKSTHSVYWDWQKALAYDGESYLDIGGYTDPTQSQPTGNRLYLDVDLSQGQGPDTIVGHATDDDYDTDGVPDSLDNAPESPNGDQRDTDHDMYGNICDADFDNDGIVGNLDLITFNSNYNQAVPPADENVDMDGGNYVGGSDLSKFGIRFNTSAPWF